MAEPLLLEVKDLNIEFHDHLIPETVVYDFDLMLDKGEIVGRGTHDELMQSNDIYREIANSQLNKAEEMKGE